MVDVLIEINGLEQLKVIEPELINELCSSLNHLFLAWAIEAPRNFGSVLLYRFSPGKRELGGLFEKLLHGWSMLEAKARKLRGLNFVVVKEEFGDDEELEAKLWRYLFTVKPDGSFWMEPGAAELFSPFAELSKEEQGFLVTGSRKDSTDNHDSILTFLDGHCSMDGLLDSFTPFLNGEKTGILFLWGPPGSGKIHALDYLRRHIAFRKEDLPFLRIEPPEGFTGVGVPLLEAMVRRGWKGIASMLSPGSMVCWNSLFHLLERDPETVRREDAELIFALYLEAYVAEMKAALLPPILFIEGLDRYRRETVRSLSRCFGLHQGKEGLLAVISSREGELPAEFSDYAVNKMAFQLWHQKELTRMVDEELLVGLDVEKEETAISLYHMGLLLRRGSRGFSGLAATKRLIRELPVFHQKLLYLTFITGGLYSAEQLRALFGIDSVEPGEFRTIATDLIDLGLLAESELLRPVFPELRDYLKRELGGEGEKLASFFTVYLSKDTEGSGRNAYRNNSIMLEEQPADQSASWLLDRLGRLVCSGRLSLATPFFEEATKSLHRLSPGEGELSDHLQALYLLSAIQEGRDSLAKEIISLFNERPEPRDWKVRNLRRLALGEYLLAVHAYRKAMEPAKAALLELQDLPGTPGEAVANLLLGRVILAMGRIDEAKDYFNIAGEVGFSPDEEDHSEEVALWSALAVFLGGNMSAALREAERGAVLARNSGKRQWELYADFLCARVLFALGRYEEALNRFFICLNNALLYPEEGYFEMVEGWIARCQTYQGKIESAIKRLSPSVDNPEHLFFLSEAAFLDERYDQAFEAIESSCRLEKDRLKLFSRPLPWNWESGFACVEDLAFAVPGGHGVLYQMARAWRGLILSRIGRIEEAKQELSRITREEKLADNDPYSHLYLFFQTLTMSDSGQGGTQEGLDRLTQLSKALRSVQGISSRIEVPVDRQDYLKRNYWNAKLTAQGRAAKLI
ncbi:tetratricopeptide repeat protein [Sediminispirochaeta bajacaliforniensis]|uniref:hypothetical protein n=1 Tax=Sediminispirochaeta bajacaliforniensis TaxID=148 RepID=UPI00039E9844|nr:hypothetical protein [Sediminispirochaeta bajacaliforniensis]